MYCDSIECRNFRLNEVDGHLHSARLVQVSRLTWHGSQFGSLISRVLSLKFSFRPLPQFSAKDLACSTMHQEPHDQFNTRKPELFLTFLELRQ